MGLLWVWGPATGPLVAEERFRLSGWTGSSEIVFGSQKQESRVPQGRDTLFERQISEERLTLRNTLTVLDPNVLTVNYGLTLGFLQSQLTDNQVQGDGDGRLRALDVTATLRPLSYRRLTLLFNSHENETPVEFAGSRRLETESLGLSMHLGREWFPGSIRLNDQKLQSTTEFGEAVRAIDQRRRTLTYNGANSWSRHRLNVSYRLDDLDDVVAPRFSNRSQTGNLSHRLELLAPGLAILQSTVRYFERHGELASSSFRIDEELRLQHRKNLLTSYRYVDESFKSFSGPPSDSRRLIVGLTHRFYQSLVTDLFGGRARSRSNGSRVDLVEVGLGSRYRKRLPGGGRLLGHINARHESRDSLRGGGQDLVERERHVVHLGVVIRLELPAVIPGSVVVTDSLRSTIFEPDIDYELLVFGDFTEIVPLVGGRMREGERILVEYRIEAPAASEFTTFRYGADVSIDYGWIAPFARLRRFDNRLVGGVQSRLLNDQRNLSYGLVLRHNGPRLQLISFNEIGRRDSELQTYDTVRLGESLTFTPRRDWAVRVRFAFSETDFTVPVRLSESSEGRLSLRWSPRSGVSLEPYVSRRISKDTVAPDQTFDRLGLQGRWTLGKLTVLASAESWSRSRQDSILGETQHDGRRVSVRVTRRFFPGRPAIARRGRSIEPWPEDLPGLWSGLEDESPLGVRGEAGRDVQESPSESDTSMGGRL